MWFRVLATCYGVDGRRLRDGGPRGSSWWREIASIREGVGEPGGGWFGEHVAQYSDMWQWQPDPDTDYTVRGAYQLLTTLDSVTIDNVEHLIWHPRVPLKVSIFAWRLLRDRQSRPITFISCSFFGSLWALVCTWIDISSTSSTTIQDHFDQFTYSAGGSRARRSFLQLIWLVSIWVIWTERNHRLFRGSTSIPHQLLDKIKLFLVEDEEC
ncbi:heat shock protein [Trifolium pratense]|uniref:Heat shock protein n=1 Tax=Trifolium pratense TaxID=57577 RepID=A0A2K3ML67_TRIPR|nr:heat shock protein [Trifolium pratense]